MQKPKGNQNLNLLTVQCADFLEHKCEPYHHLSQHDLLVLNALSSDEDSGDSGQTCADSQSHCWVSQANVQTRHAFAARISDNPITI